MRIGLNLHGFTPRCGGVETYIKNLFSTLQRIDSENEYLIFCDRVGSRVFTPQAPNFSARVADYDWPSARSFFRLALQRVSRYDLLTREFRNRELDVIHHPFTILNPQGLSTPAVLTFHDMQHEYMPELFSKEELKWRRRNYLSSVREAGAIITVSGHARECLVERYQVQSHKIHVIHHGLSDQFRRTDDPDQLNVVALQYSIKRPFMIYPAGTWAHKNHLRLLAAIRIALDRKHFDGELLLTGAPKTSHEQVMNEIDRLGLSGVARWLGYVPDRDLPHLYSLARLMVFPSLFEGFGLPLVEAMACGCPIACADATSLPEICGDAALFFDPTSTEEMADRMTTLWHDDALQAELRCKGETRARSFSWDRAARKTLNVYLQTAR